MKQIVRKSSKTLLLIHGFPQETTPDSPVFIFFNERKYKIYTPRLFSSDKEFNLENSLQIIRDSLGKNKPDVILGFSLGGLLLPHIASDFPDSTLIFISTGTRFNPDNAFYKLGISVLRTPIFIPAIGLAKAMPDFFLTALYKFFNPCNKGEDLELYERDKKANFAVMRAIPAEKQRQIFDFISRIDNTMILKTIRNKTIILAGENDALMTINENRRLNKLIPGSRLICVKNSHFSVIERRRLKLLDKYF